MIEVFPSIRGEVSVWIFHPQRGYAYHVVHEKNLIVDSAKPLVADLLRGDPSASALRAMAFGRDNTAAAGGQTKLVDEFCRVEIPPVGTDVTGSFPKLRNIRSSNVVTIGVSCGAGLNTAGNPSTNQFKEYGLCGGVIELTAPSSAPTCTPSTSGGSLATGNYDVSYAWISASGETVESPAQTNVNIASGSSGKITVTIPALPSGFLLRGGGKFDFAVYANTAGNARRYIGGGTASTSTTTAFDVTAIPAAGTLTSIGASSDNPLVVTTASTHNLDAANKDEGGAAIYLSGNARVPDGLYHIQVLSSTTFRVLDDGTVTNGGVTVKQRKPRLGTSTTNGGNWERRPWTTTTNPTALRPGTANLGRLLNRATFTAVTPGSGEYVYVEATLTFN